MSIDLFRRYMAPEGDDGGAGGGGSDDGKGGEGDGGQGGDDQKTLLGGAKGGEGEGDQGEPGPWAWQEDVPGTGTVPPWFKADKYKSVAEQAQAAVALETKLGPAADLIGAPEESYELPAMPEGVEGEWDTDDPMLQVFQETAKELNLSQKAHDAIVQKMGALLAQEQTAAQESVADALAKLGTNASARIEAVNNYISNTLGAEFATAIDNAVGTNVAAYQAIEALVAKASGDAQLSGLPGRNGPGFSKTDIEAERYKTYPEGHRLAGKQLYEHDKEHRAKVDGMYKELFPGEDRTEVG